MHASCTNEEEPPPPPYVLVQPTTRPAVPLGVTLPRRARGGGPQLAARENALLERRAPPGATAAPDVDGVRARHAHSIPDYSPRGAVVLNMHPTLGYMHTRTSTEYCRLGYARTETRRHAYSSYVYIHVCTYAYIYIFCTFAMLRSYAHTYTAVVFYFYELV